MKLDCERLFVCLIVFVVICVSIHIELKEQSAMSTTSSVSRFVEGQ